jgi:hypothetical protein
VPSSVFGNARCRPTAVQELLLKSCLAAADDALAAWERWCACTDLDGSTKSRSASCPWPGTSPDGAERSHLRDRQGRLSTRFTAQLLFRELSGILDTLAEARIDAMLLKGSSLATPTTESGDAADGRPRRPGPTGGVRAIALLQRDGWQPVKQTPPHRLVGHAHAVSLVRDQTNLDLHWNALWPQRRADADRPFWESAQRIEHQGRPAFALAPTDELFHACMHGARRSQNAYSWAPVPLARWVTDAFMIARSCDIDWVRIDALSDRFHATLHLHDAFLYLREGLGFPVPGELLAEWARARSPADQLHYELALTPRPLRFFPALPRFRFWKSYKMKTYIERHANDVDQASLVQHLAGFPPYVIAFIKADLDAERLRDVPAQLARKLANRPSLMRP